MAAEITVVFEKLVPEGKSLGRHEGLVVFAWGILPGERARVRVRRARRTFVEADLVEVLEPAAGRLPPGEAHHLSCSPWQCFTYPFQVETKRALLESIYRDIAKEPLSVERFVAAPETSGYRTKIEFSFA